MARLELTLACWDYDRTRALMDGRVEVEGCAITYLPLPPEETFFRAFRHAEFDICELSLSSYAIARSRPQGGDRPLRYAAIPVFVSRSFRHSGIYVRSDRVTAAEDLRGRIVGVPEYQMTAAVWIRILLETEYGVRPAEIRWRNGGVEEPGRHEKLDLSLPPEIELEPIGPDRTLSAMLEAGEIDALVGARAPSCFRRGAPGIARLFPDFRRAERDWFRKTGIFPIMHVIGLRQELAAAHPWLAASLFKAFAQAKAANQAGMREVAALKVSLPWLASELEETVALMGEDFWPYGFAANRATLALFLQHHHRQGLSARRLEPEELFVASTLEAPKV